MSQEGSDFKPKPVRQRGALRRLAVLDAAAVVFLEKGYEAASVSEIVARAGGSRRMIYDQFRDKDGLFEEMMIVQCARILDPLSDDRLLAAKPPVALGQFGRRFMQVMMSDGVQAIRRIVMAEGVKFPRIAQIFFEAGVDPAIARISHYIARLNEEGDLYFDDPQLTAVLFLSMVQGDAVDRITAGASHRRSAAMIDLQMTRAVQMILTSGRKSP